MSANHTQVNAPFCAAIFSGFSIPGLVHKFVPARQDLHSNIPSGLKKKPHTEKSYQTNPKSDCIHHFPIDFKHKQTRPFVFQINRKMVNTIWFRVGLIRFQKDVSVCTDHTHVRETRVPRHQGTPFSTLGPPQHYRTEGYKEGPWLVPHYAERRWVEHFPF